MIEAIKDSIQEIIKRADECKKDQNSDFEKGRLMAFNEVLSILQTDLAGERTIEKLLDFDIDKRY